MPGDAAAYGDMLADPTHIYRGATRVKHAYIEQLQWAHDPQKKHTFVRESGSETERESDVKG
jgi:hypothetical protein